MSIETFSTNGIEIHTPKDSPEILGKNKNKKEEDEGMKVEGEGESEDERMEVEDEEEDNDGMVVEEGEKEENRRRKRKRNLQRKLLRSARLNRIKSLMTKLRRRSLKGEVLGRVRQQARRGLRLVQTLPSIIAKQKIKKSERLRHFLKHSRASRSITLQRMLALARKANMRKWSLFRKHYTRN